MRTWSVVLILALGLAGAQGAAAGGTLTEPMALHTQGVNHELGRGVERDLVAAEDGNTVAPLDLVRLLARVNPAERAAGDRVLARLRSSDDCLR